MKAMRIVREPNHGSELFNATSGEEKIVKESNEYYDWYKKAPRWNVKEEFEIN